MNLGVESGPYELRVGRSANGIVDSAEFEVTATKDVPANGRTYFSKTRTTPVE
ncbi:hypothetical protein [Haladaptatus sp. DYF46]|uniref:hypothetical protein n=1 Tax=Haladaptatus sp. DYF46 TaxID=2886041 RepID=UPI001E51692A|nr:hypothetical protein [Haladaptatus sp. DYF46]